MGLPWTWMKVFAWCPWALGALYCSHPCPVTDLPPAMGRWFTLRLSFQIGQMLELWSKGLWLCTLKWSIPIGIIRQKHLLSSVPPDNSFYFLGGGQFRLPVSWESFWVTRTCWLITPIACTSWIALSPSKWVCIFSDTKSPGPCAHPAVG